MKKITSNADYHSIGFSISVLSKTNLIVVGNTVSEQYTIWSIVNNPSIVEFPRNINIFKNMESTTIIYPYFDKKYKESYIANPQLTMEIILKKYPNNTLNHLFKKYL